MRLFLLPISTRRVLIYCERTHPGKSIAAGPHSTGVSTTDVSPAGIPPDSRLSESKTPLDKAVDKAAAIWASWERADKGWRKQAAHYGGLLLNRIPFEEWGLKTVPALPTRAGRSGAKARVAMAKASLTPENDLGHPTGERIPGSIVLQKGVEEVTLGSNKVGKFGSSSVKLDEQAVELLYPHAFLSGLGSDPVVALRELATNRQSLHRKRMWWSIVGMPLVSPFALVPVVPNFPFFYLAFRAWSHWRALNGARHLQHLLQENKIKFVPSPVLDSLYARAFLPPSQLGGDILSVPIPESDLKQSVTPTPQTDIEPVLSILPTTQQVEQVRDVLLTQLESSSSVPSESVATSSSTAAAEKPGCRKELLLLRKWNGNMIAHHYSLPAMGLEIERAVEQVSKALGLEPGAQSGRK